VDCGATGIQLHGGNARRRCDRCRAGRSGSGPRKTSRRLTYVSTAPRDPIPARARDGRSFACLADATEADLEAMITLHPMAGGLSALAMRLASTIDNAEEPYVAPLSTQLRATLDSLATYRAVDSW
jgi:hypothetical protein